MKVDKNLFNYKKSVAILKKWLQQKLITEDEFYNMKREFVKIYKQPS